MRDDTHPCAKLASHQNIPMPCTSTAKVLRSLCRKGKDYRTPCGPRGSAVIMCRRRSIGTSLSITYGARRAAVRMLVGPLVRAVAEFASADERVLRADLR